VIMTEIRVFSRDNAEYHDLVRDIVEDGTYVWISISRRVDMPANPVKLEEQWKGSLHLGFADSTNPEYIEHFPETRLFDETDAKKVVEFVLDNQNVDYILVHCEAGISRSAAIAQMLSYWIHGNDGGFVYGKGYHPNVLVLNEMRKAIRSVGSYPK